MSAILFGRKTCKYKTDTILLMLKMMTTLLTIALFCVGFTQCENIAFTKSYSVNIFAPTNPKAPILLQKVPETTQVLGNIKTIKKKKGKVEKESKNQVAAQFVAVHPELSVEGDISTSNKKSIATFAPGEERTNIFLKKNSFKDNDENTPPAESEGPEPDIPIELGVKEPENDNELGSAFENDPENMNKVDGKKKGCEKQPCTSSNQESGGDDDETSEPVDQDIPVELGSAIKDNSDDDVDNADVSDEKEQVTYLPFWTPRQFVIVDRSESAIGEQNIDYSGSGDGGVEQEDFSGSGSAVNGEYYGTERKRSVSENSDSVQQLNTSTIYVNTDGDYDGELLTASKNPIEIKPRGRNARKRRSTSVNVKGKSKWTKKNKHRGKKKLQKKVKNLKKLSGPHNSKRSDIEADKELLQTIENLNSMAASKREVSGHKNKKPMRGYMKHLAQDVRGVLKEAKTALRDTAHVIRGLRRVVSGAGVLTSFTNNAVKFANYFSMEPSNATVDYLEEKAIVSVLEAQKAAEAAKQAAKLAKLAYSKTKEVETRMEIAEKSHKKGNMLSNVKIADQQARRAEKAAKLAVSYKAKTEKDVMIMDQELRKMGSQMQEENDVKSAALKNLTLYKSSFDQMKTALKNHTRNKAKSHSDDAPNADQQVSPDIQLLLPKIYKETDGKISASQDDDKKDVETVEEPNQSSGYENYFYMKQKQLEKELSNSTKSSSSSQVAGNKRVDKKFVGKPVKIIDMIPPSEPVEDVKQPDDRLELEYIASLNKKIASIKREEEEATQRLRAVELARQFAAGKNRFSEDLNPSKILEENADIRALEKSETRSEVLSPKHPKTSVVNQYSTHETTLSNMRNSAKKQTIRKQSFKRPILHLYPGEYTGFKKQDISNYDHTKSSYPRYEVAKSNLVSLKSKVVSPKNEAYNDIEGALSEDENTVVAEDFDPARKRQQILSENNLMGDVTSDDDIENTIQSGWDIESGDLSGSGDFTAKKSKVAMIKKINHGPVSVTVMVNKNTVKRGNVLTNRKENLIDPFGFNQIRDTNEGGVSDRTIIPRPYTNIKRSEVPSPPVRQYTQSDVVDDNKR